MCSSHEVYKSNVRHHALEKSREGFSLGLKNDPESNTAVHEVGPGAYQDHDILSTEN